QELRLRRERHDMEPGGHAREREPREVDPRRHVLQADMDERVLVHALAEEAGEGAACARILVVLAARQAIVEDEQRAARKGRGERVDPGPGERRVFAGKSRREGTAARLLELGELA